MNQNQVDEKRLNELLENEKKYQKTVERSRYHSKKRLAKITLLSRKAIEAGITVTDQEILDEMNKNQ